MLCMTVRACVTDGALGSNIVSAMPDPSALVTAIVAAIAGSVVAALVVPAVRHWAGAVVRLCARHSRSLLTRVRSRRSAPTAMVGSEEDAPMTQLKQKYPGKVAPSRVAGRSEPCRVVRDAESAAGVGTGVITVHCDNRPLVGAEVLALFPNKTWVQAVTDSAGVASLDLHSMHLPITVFAAAKGCGAHVETGRIPAEGVLAVELSPLPVGGSMVVKQGTGHIPGLTGRLNPIRDASDRTYLYADNIAINGGMPQPVSFVPGDEHLQLVDANGDEFLVRVAAIIGRSSLLEYSSCPRRMFEDQKERLDQAWRAQSRTQLQAEWDRLYDLRSVADPDEWAELMERCEELRRRGWMRYCTP